MEKASFPERAGPWHGAGRHCRPTQGPRKQPARTTPLQCEKCLLPQDGVFSAQALLVETESLYKLFFRCFVCMCFVGGGGVGVSHPVVVEGGLREKNGTNHHRFPEDPFDPGGAVRGRLAVAETPCSSFVGLPWVPHDQRL